MLAAVENIVGKAKDEKESTFEKVKRKKNKGRDRIKPVPA